jgi:HAD superfamily hydrolase (TIGR01548 family)
LNSRLLTPLSKKLPANRSPKIIVFDVDGVLVDTRGSFQKTTLETVRLFTGKRVTRAELHSWKNRPGFNDDWKLSTTWINSLGHHHEYAEVKAKFQQIYWGKNNRGNVLAEKWLLPKSQLRRLSQFAELAIFTGRTKYELDYTLNRAHVRRYFRQMVTIENVKHGKPDPEGLLQILRGRDPASAIYLGDNVDDAVAAQSARVPFVGVLPVRSEERRQRIATLRRLGALKILGEITQLAPWLRLRVTN